MTQEMSVKIVGGPSKWDLSMSLFHGDFTRREPVTFRLEWPVSDGPNTLAKADVVIDSLQREDGSGENWNFRGRIERVGEVKGFFSTKNRKGLMKLRDVTKDIKGVPDSFANRCEKCGRYRDEIGACSEHG